MRKWVYGAIATVGSLGLVLAALLMTGVFRPDGSVACSHIGAPPGNPLFNGTATTIATAQAVARFPVLMPDEPAASPTNLTQTWVAHRTVELIFGRREVTIEMAPANYGNALKDFQRFVAHNRADAAIGHVHGQPALVITPRTDGCRSNPAWVEFKHDGIDVNVISYSYDIGTLLAVADSLRQRATGTGHGQ
jgi:hypothetical protein